MAVAIDAANKYRQVVGQLLEAHKQLMSINQEYVAADILGGITDDDPLADPPIPSDFSDITKAQFGSGVTAAQAIMTAIVTNQTNLYIMSDGSQR